MGEEDAMSRVGEKEDKQHNDDYGRGANTIIHLHVDQ
jgi:hypothetical protein